MRTVLRRTAMTAGLPLLVAACAVADAQPAPPSNDDFAGAVMASVEPPGHAFEHRVSTEGATREEGEPGCISGGTVWYLFHAAVSAEYTVDVSGSDFPASVGVYRITDFVPSPPGGSLVEVSCTSGAVVTFTGHSSDGLFAIQAGGAPGVAGDLHLRLACEPACAPTNDGIGSLLLFEVPFTDSVSTEAATLEAGEPQPCGNIGRTVWYRIDTFERAGDHVQIDVFGDGFVEPVAAVYRLDLDAGPSPPGALGLIGCDDGAAGTNSANIAFTTEPFTQYHVQVGGVDGAAGVLGITMTCQEPRCPFQVVGIDTGGGEPQRGGNDAAGGVIAPPDSGSAGLR